MVNEMVRRIRNPLNALLLNIDNLEDEIAEVDVETSRERLKRMQIPSRSWIPFSVKFSGFQNCQNPESQPLTSMH